VATDSRVCWAGLKPSDFEICTTYENSKYCKPNPMYYTDLAERMGLNPEECLMVGNDVRDDMIAETVGMKVFLLTDCLINIKNADISKYPQGSYKELIQYIENL
ncbi:MAG: HAD family hydrolase, partial [Clostridia bacterium]|nr:HAD family hydrolase [Clostridia bacterium]